MSYAQATILVTLLVMIVWQLSPEAMVKRLHCWNDLAIACGYRPGHIISSSQLRRRRDYLGLWTYFWTFCVLVWVLKTRGLTVGKDWVIDSTIIDAFATKDAYAGWWLGWLTIWVVLICLMRVLGFLHHIRLCEPL